MKNKQEIIKKLAFKEGRDYSILNRIPIEKMGTLDLHNPDLVPFPENKFEISIWKTESNPPRILVVSKKDGWAMKFSIALGEALQCDSGGNDIEIFKYIRKYIPIWLEMKCFENKDITNKENAINIWKRYHNGEFQTSTRVKI